MTRSCSLPGDGSAAAPRSLARRQVLAGGAGWMAVVLVRPAAAQDAGAAATFAAELEAAVRGFTGGAPVQAGKVKLDIAPLVENGNTVPISVTVDHPMTEAEHVQAIAVFNERNPQRDVARFALTPRSGRARVDTRIRLATSQKLVAVARLSDGSFWSHTVDVVVTLAACIES
jgi:sulfur-oxidizing protein SoxY